MGFFKNVVSKSAFFEKPLNDKNFYLTKIEKKKYIFRGFIENAYYTYYIYYIFHSHNARNTDKQRKKRCSEYFFVLTTPYYKPTTLPYYNLLHF